MSDTYRAERRADRAAEREQDRADRLAIQRMAYEERRRDQQAAADRRQEAADRAEQKRREASARRAERAHAAGAWLQTHPADAFVATVMVASIVPAVASQVGALHGAGVVVALAALLAVMLEGGAWAITMMGQQAQARGQQTTKYRVGTWICAACAALVNAWHGLQTYRAHPWVALVLAASSLFAVYVWELRVHGGHGPTREERREQRARRAHAKARRAHHKRVARVADRLVSALPHGELAADEAFERAWVLVHGDELGMTPELRGLAAKARAGKRGRKAAMAAPVPAPVEAPRAAEEPTQEKPQVAPHTPRAPKPRVVAAAKTPTPQVRAARTLAAETARAATPEQAEQEKADARAWVLAQLANGRTVTWQTLAERTARGETWCRARIREVAREKTDERDESARDAA